MASHLFPILFALAFVTGSLGSSAYADQSTGQTESGGCAYSQSTSQLVQAYGFAEAGCFVLGPGDCNDLVVVRIVLLGGNSDCLSGSDGCLNGGFVSIMIIGSYNTICSGSGSVCSGNLVLDVVVIGSNNRICTSTGGVVCSGNLVAQSVIKGDNNSFCSASILQSLNQE